MSAPVNHWKLGLFVLCSLGLGLFTILFFAGRALQEETVRYASYFDESVGGLNSGSSVSFRGVTIGKVAEINIAPDRRHVELRYDLGVSELKRLGLVSERGGRTEIHVPSDLRIQIGSSGLTGSKYLQIDFFNELTHPPPELPFKLARNYIPATPSTIKNLESSLARATDQFPEFARQIGHALSELNGFLGEVRAEQLPQQASGTLRNATAVLGLLHKKLDQVPVQELSHEVRGLLGQANTAMARADVTLQRVNSERGLLASMQRASDAVGDVAGNANTVVYDLDATLRDLRETVVAVRQLAEALERDPDMLLKGRSKVHE